MAADTPTICKLQQFLLKLPQILDKDQQTRHQELVEKWNAASPQLGDIPPSHGNRGGGRRRSILTIDGQFYVVDQCAVCNDFMPISFFSPSGNTRSKNIFDTPTGLESVDSRCIPCCRANTRARDLTMEGRFRQLIKKDNGDLTVDWAVQQWAQQEGRCHISNLQLTLEPGLWNTVSVQNNRAGRKHFQADCVLIMQCLQVQEHAIPNLKNAWGSLLQTMQRELLAASDTTPLLQEFDRRLHNSPRQNGVMAPTQRYADAEAKSCDATIAGTARAGQNCGRICVRNETRCWLHLERGRKLEIDANPALKTILLNIPKSINPEWSKQCMRLHLPRILRDMVENYASQDRRSISRRATEKCKLMPDDIVQKFRGQSGRCFYSGIPFSLDRSDPNYWSVERLDNAECHTIANTVLVCRIMNGASQMSKEILQAMLAEYSRVHK